MDRTNYALLSLVSIVAIVAVIAMFLHARVPSQGLPPIQDAPSVVANAVLDVPITGKVTLGGSEIAAPAPSRTSGSSYDLDWSGSLDANDAKILSLVIDRVQFCPKNRNCDIDGNGVIDLRDLGQLNSLIIAARTAKESSTSSPTSVASVSTDNSGMIGAAGGSA